MVKMKKKYKKAHKILEKQYPTLEIINEKEIAQDFAVKVYKKFENVTKAIVLFGSQTKDTANASSDIDIIIIIDDASVQWDQELIAWYREELGKIIRSNPYKKELHINTVKLSTWWQDLMKGDPVVVNIIRYGEPLIDIGGFFSPLKILLQEGKIKSTPEAVYTALQRAPLHMARSKASELGAIEGLYWAMVDSAHAALMAAKQTPPSPEHIPALLKEIFVETKNLRIEYVTMYRDLYILHKKITYGEVFTLKGSEIEIWQARTDKFVQEMTRLVRKITEV